MIVLETARSNDRLDREHLTLRDPWCRSVLTWAVLQDMFCVLSRILLPSGGVGSIREEPLRPEPDERRTIHDKHDVHSDAKRSLVVGRFLVVKTRVV